MTLRRAAPLLAALAAAAAAGCVEERVVHRRPPMAGLQGAKVGGVVTSDPNYFRPPELSLPHEGIIRVTDPDTGEVTLYAKSGRHLFSHILATLEADERDLFRDQVLSEQTRQQFYEVGRSPDEAFDMLLPDLHQIRATLSRMPAGELSPQVTTTKVGRNRFRLVLPRSQWQGLTYVGVEMVFERSNYRLGWFVRPSDV